MFRCFAYVVVCWRGGKTFQVFRSAQIRDLDDAIPQKYFSIIYRLPVLNLIPIHKSLKRISVLCDVTGNGRKNLDLSFRSRGIKQQKSRKV